MKYILIAVFIVLTSVSCDRFGEDYSGMGVTKKEAVRIAEKKAAELGYDINNMELEVNKFNTAWNKYITQEEQRDYAINIKKKLTNKEYWTIYYSPKSTPEEIVLGGDVCFFIDSTSAEILSIYRGE